MTATTRKSPARVPATVELPDLDGEAGAEHSEPGTTPDLEPILPDPGSLTILGIPVTVRRLQTREIMAGIRILVNEMGTGITAVDLDTPMDQQRDTLVALVLTAAPNAADEVLKLLASLVEPRDKRQVTTLAAIMDNPPPAVTLDVLAVVWAQEYDDLSALVGKARQLLGYAQALQRTRTAGT
jgi:hypothetical protein